MIFTRAGERWRIVTGQFCGLYLARWMEGQTKYRGLSQDTAAGYWQIVGPNRTPSPIL